MTIGEVRVELFTGVMISCPFSGFRSQAPVSCGRGMNGVSSKHILDVYMLTTNFQNFSSLRLTATRHSLQINVPT